jgi:putative heme iron utilization protein
VTSSHAARCRALLASATTATLATIARDPRGYPYASLVNVAARTSGRPILLLSSLAEHTANLAAQPEASLLVTAATAGEDPLAAERVTLIGPCTRVPPAEVEAAREAFLAAHPSAARYASFADFALFLLSPLSVRYIGGFGKMSWVSAEEYLGIP